MNLSDSLGYLPTIATALVNPVAGVAQIAAKFLGPKVGLDAASSTVEAVTQKLEGLSPEEIVKMKSLDVELQEHLADNGIKLAELELENRKQDSQDLGAVNATMQVESKSEHWIQWLWRPLSGLLFAPTIIAYYIVLPACGFHLPVIDPMVWTMWGTVIGITAWHRGVGQNIQLKNGNGNGNGH